SQLHGGREISREQLDEYKQLSADDKMYSRALRYVALRPRTVWELQQYLTRHDASPALVELIVNKLTNIGLLDDAAYARSFVADRRSLRPASHRKLVADLRKKHIASSLIHEAVGNDAADERQSLQSVITKARRQTKYQTDELKLMQYLARQGFHYDDIKQALQHED
ncbi:MAG TPA: regulatory protein RecX, partial [Candidatus Saccharimonadales bacterium]|nr:regulatory protein RecX [Candidatus Saccharimonadales bacterium]